MRFDENGCTVFESEVANKYSYFYSTIRSCYYQVFR